MWGIQWAEWGKNGKLQFKQRDFSTEKAREKFVERLLASDNLFEIRAYSDPRSES